ncbi:MAG TPA: hypothetical protein VG961_14250, partial [Ignavibacteria bacterium]|nr:hypothetical protein [Ignavibacteria bacterium]
YLDLLVKNYQKGDADIIYNIVKKLDTSDKAHSVIWSIVEIFNKNKTKECRKIMEHLYYNLACGPHRFDVVKILKDNGILNSKIKKEMEEDLSAW